jgi:hypothetical protein
VRSSVDADAEPIHELAAKPARHRSQQQRRDFEQEDRNGWRGVRGIASQPPGECESGDDNDVTRTVQQPNSLGSCP